ncbi:GNAT family N-acetyltransferase [Iningainema sp. BLCCT55]|uniref:GNAT family N-acetyltransferase n=1 Tax=Iningainema tapete BLCC-T55 TaxID=2748662 RepID=A0A8J6XS45_9CYAN|nr:GNAT family N-acetyltransferase [Iningainema tapete BLCC-T55]
MTTEIVSLSLSQIDEASEILQDAFNQGPIFRYLIPEAEQTRANFLRWFFKRALRYSQHYNHVYTTAGNLKGVAVWLPPERSIDTNILQLIPTALALPFQLGWSKLGRGISLLSAIEERHKLDMPSPHWYLSILGVAPACQGQGVGSSLLQPILKRADNEGLPCYLETATQSAVRFYQRHGFEVVWTGTFTEGSPCLWTMKREAYSD